MVRIPKKFKEALLNRFDPNNALYIFGAMVIPIPCPLCETYDECIGCPFEDYPNKCDGFLMENDLLPQHVHITKSQVRWEPSNSYFALEWLKKVASLLRHQVEWIEEV